MLFLCSCCCASCQFGVNVHAQTGEDCWLPCCLYFSGWPQDQGLFNTMPGLAGGFNRTAVVCVCVGCARWTVAIARVLLTLLLCDLVPHLLARLASSSARARVAWRRLLFRCSFSRHSVDPRPWRSHRSCCLAWISRRCCCDCFSSLRSLRCWWLVTLDPQPCELEENGLCARTTLAPAARARFRACARLCGNFWQQQRVSITPSLYMHDASASFYSTTPTFRRC